MHTNGPWRVETGTTLIWGACDQFDASSFGMGYPIAEARISPSNQRWAKGPNEDEGEANARLIAAAPDLLEALEASDMMLKRLVPEGSYCPGINDVLERSRAAITKAKGTTNA